MVGARSSRWDKFHARDAFVLAQTRIAAEIRCIIWAATSLMDLHILDVEIWSDCGAAYIVERFQRIRNMFRSCHVMLSSAKKIAMSVVIKDRRFCSLILHFQMTKEKKFMI